MKYCTYRYTYYTIWNDNICIADTSYTTVTSPQHKATIRPGRPHHSENHYRIF